MTPEGLLALLGEVERGALSAADALARLRVLPFEDLGFAKIDHHRELRQGAPEVIYGEGKTPAQVAAIVQAMVAAQSNVLVTRVSPEIWAAVRAVAPAATHHEPARAVTVIHSAPRPLGTVAVVCAGTSDLPVAEEAAVCGAFFGAEIIRLADVGVAGLHRLLDAKDRLDAAEVAIVVAGMEGALPSVVGGLVPIPVIAVPTSVGYGASFGGISALLGMLNSCAAGVTVVNIDNGFGAAAAAARILRRRPLRAGP
jgi:hypothetical protein